MTDTMNKPVRLVRDTSDGTWKLQFSMNEKLGISMLNRVEAKLLLDSLKNGLSDLTEINEIKSKLGAIDNYIESLRTSLGAALGQLDDGDVNTAKDEIKEMDSDLRDLCDLVNTF